MRNGRNCLKYQNEVLGKVLLITDCRLYQKSLNRDHTVTIYTTDGGDIHDVLRLTEQKISRQFKTVVIGGLFWDSFHSGGSRYNNDHVLLAPTNNPTIPELANLVVQSSEKWRTNYKVHVFWAFPYKTDVLKYNKNMEAMDKRKPFVMTLAEEAEAGMVADRIQNCVKFREIVEMVQLADTNSVVKFVQLDTLVSETAVVGRSAHDLRLLERRSRVVLAALLRFAIEGESPPRPGDEQPTFPVRVIIECALTKYLTEHK